MALHLILLFHSFIQVLLLLHLQVLTFCVGLSNLLTVTPSQFISSCSHLQLGLPTGQNAEWVPGSRASTDALEKKMSFLPANNRTQIPWMSSLLPTHCSDSKCKESVQ